MSAKSYRRILSTLVLFSILFSGCRAISALSNNKVVVSIVYGSEKQAWLEPLVNEFNASNQRIAKGSKIEVQITPMGSIESVEQILSGQIKPVVWSPASSLYIPVVNQEWRKTHTDDLVDPNAKDLVLSPVVIAMWKPMAEALGWPNKAIGWEDISRLSTSENGWAEYNYPDWGKFKFGHTHPDYSNSGLVAIIAQAYAAAGKQRGLTEADLEKPEVQAFMADVQSSIIHYGTSTGFFATRMFELGPSYLSAAVLYENLIVEQENKRLSGASQQLPVVAIYPKEGTFWANHPYAILNAPWVLDEEKEAAELFENFLLDETQQQKALQFGFRPANLKIAFTAPLDAQHGVDTSQPKTRLEIPTASVIQKTQKTWEITKKPVDLVIAIDVSGSMSGGKIAAARTSLVEFIRLLGDRDRLQVITFGSEVNRIIPLSDLGPNREDITRRVSALIEGGDTALNDAIIAGYQDLQTQGNPNHIRAMVILSDGNDTISQNSLDQVVQAIGTTSESGGNGIKVFTIGYGDGYDEDVLKNIAEPTGGKMYDGKPENINKVYSEIATFF